MAGWGGRSHSVRTKRSFVAEKGKTRASASAVGAVANTGLGGIVRGLGGQRGGALGGNRAGWAGEGSNAHIEERKKGRSWQTGSCYPQRINRGRGWRRRREKKIKRRRVAPPTGASGSQQPREGATVTAGGLGAEGGRRRQAWEPRNLRRRRDTVEKGARCVKRSRRRGPRTWW